MRKTIGNAAVQMSLAVTFPRSGFCAGVLMAFISLSGWNSAVAQDAAEGRPTVVARLQLAPGALDTVSNSTDLVAALREHLSVELALPGPDAVGVQFRGFGGTQDAKGPPLTFVFPVFRAEGPLERQSFSVAAAIRASHGEGEADAPWQRLQHTEAKAADRWDTLAEALEVGLPQSAKGSAPRTTKPVKLRVKAVHLLEFEYDGQGGGQYQDFQYCCEAFDKQPVLQIMPGIALPPAWSDNGVLATLGFKQNILVIELDY